MNEIPKELFVTRSVHKNIGMDPNNSILSCGFIHHTRHLSQNENLVFKYYGALLLLSGEGTYIDKDGKSTRIYPGCFIQRIPYVRHSTITKEDGKWLEFFVCFGYETHCSLLHMGLLSESPVLYPGLTDALLDKCLLFYEQLSRASSRQLPQLLLEAQRFVFTIYDMHRKQTVVPSTRSLLDKSRELLGSGRIPDDSCRGVAEYLGIGYENFRKMFRREFHMPPHTYLIQKRLNTAKELLLDDTLSIQEIASRTGYPDSFSFSKQFKKYTALTPREFRSLHQIPRSEGS